MSVNFIRDYLKKCFPDPKPFLHHTDAFTLLIAVILSARCTDKKVNQVTETLFLLGPTAKKMAALPLATIKEIIQPCGLSPAKSKAIKETSRIIAEKYKGEVPKTFEELEDLPGVGHKTASVVMSQAFNKSAFPVDTHIYRLARRWGLSHHKSVKGVEEDLKKLFPPSSWHALHLQMIEAGRTFCTARGHTPALCPICSHLKIVPSDNTSLKVALEGPRRKRSSPSRKA